MPYLFIFARPGRLCSNTCRNTNLELQELGGPFLNGYACGFRLLVSYFNITGKQGISVRIQSMQAVYLCTQCSWQAMHVAIHVHAAALVGEHPKPFDRFAAVCICKMETGLPCNQRNPQELFVNVATVAGRQYSHN